MKFRVSSKDLGYYAIFSILLYYLCALITGNIHSLSTDGAFCGLNPIPGIKLFWPTLILFIMLTLIIITSVSSLIFERKKGIGFEISEKDEKGYNRWANDSEIKHDKDVEVVKPLIHDSKYAGIPLVNDGKRLWVDNGEYHNLVIGSTGSGKSQTCVEPMVEILVKKGESMVITDPKGELYQAIGNYLKERNYNVILLNFRDPQRGNAWNPLMLPYLYYKEGNRDKATELLDDVAANILYDPNNKADPFWEKSAADYFSGICLGLFEDAKPEEININSVNYLAAVGEDKYGVGTFIQEYFKMKGESSNAYVFASNTINAPADTKGGILSVFRQKIRLFASRENLSEMLSYSDFDMRDIGKEKTAVFIVIHDEKKTYHSLATIFIKQCYETLIDVAQQNGRKLPYRTNFILDEFANMPPLRDVTTMVTAARSRKIRFTFIIQNFAQLKSVYGNEDAETIKGNCGNLIYLISTELACLEEISKMCGDVKSKEKDKTDSRPLVTVTDLQKLKLFEAIILRWRIPPFKTKYTPNYKMDWGHPADESDFPHRDKKTIQLFQLKEFVKEEKKKKMLDSIDSNQGNEDGGFSPFGNNPFASGSPFGSSSPFGSNLFNPNPMQESSSGGADNLSNLEFDKLMKSIDEKIAELDREEEEKRKKESKDIVNPINNINVEAPNVDLFKPQSDFDLLNSNSEKIDNDVDDSISNAVFESLNNSSVSDSSYNDDSYERMKELNIFNTSEILVGNEKSKVAVATGSPVEAEIDPLDVPKVENVDVIKPNYEIKNNTLNKATNIETLSPEPVDSSVNVNVEIDKLDEETDNISDDAFFDDFFSEE